MSEDLDAGEAARRIENSRYIGSNFATDARIVASAYLSLLAATKNADRLLIGDCPGAASDVLRAALKGINT